MFRFFTQKEWALWSWLGSALILSSLWIQVEIDVKINEWFGQFYDMIQKALATPNAITIGEYWASLGTFIYLAMIYVAIAVAKPTVKKNILPEKASSLASPIPFSALIRSYFSAMDSSRDISVTWLSILAKISLERSEP